MDSSPYKRYHEDGYDSRQCLEHYFSDKSDMVFAEDALIFPIENLIKTFTEGHITGDVLIDLSPGSLVHHLFAACEFFKHIIALKAKDRCIMELKRWVDERTGAFDWGHAANLHVGKGETRQHLESYVSDSPDKVSEEDSVIFPIENLTKTFTEGHIKGDVLIDLSLGSMVHHLFAACDFFKHIIVLKINDRCIMELKRWVDERTGAFDWRHAAKLHEDVEENRDLLQDKEGKVRSALEHVLKCDLEKEDIMHPIVLPPADCVLSFLLLDTISKDQDDYMRYLRKFSSLLKPGGHIILIGALGMTYYTIGKHKFRAFSYDEDFARKALAGEGFIIDHCEVKMRMDVNDHIDYKGMIFITAHRET
ncbi:nicotinamide N-methyltransferase-like [Anomaloglossus baeobatrachus]|uniref:nicotinamide N-methyltransferase-like n=1 Tax=Anomaloglossus baeobatrachus TaxID=238106 RepID=UPI003F508D0B